MVVVLWVSPQGQACCPRPVGGTVVWGQLWLLVLVMRVPPQGWAAGPHPVDATVVWGHFWVLVHALGVPPWHRDGPKLSVLIP